MPILDLIARPKFIRLFNSPKKIKDLFYSKLSNRSSVAHTLHCSLLGNALFLAMTTYKSNGHRMVSCILTFTLLGNDRDDRAVYRLSKAS
jgi:hypothetical protein